MIWFTGDTHFGHENMLRLSDRPWSTVAQMNDAMVANINSKVAADDELYILGDFSFKMTVQDAYELRKSIACKRVHLLPGNHDKDWTQSAVADAFIVEPPICALKINRPKNRAEPLSHGRLAGHVARQLAFARAYPQLWRRIQRVQPQAGTAAL